MANPQTRTGSATSRASRSDVGARHLLGQLCHGRGDLAAGSAHRYGGDLARCHVTRCAGRPGWFLFARCNKVERERMFVLIVLTLSTVIFWALFEQAAGSMTLYADRVTDKSLFGVSLTAAQFGAANSFFIFSLAPVFAYSGRVSASAAGAQHAG